MLVAKIERGTLTVTCHKVSPVLDERCGIPERARDILHAVLAQARGAVPGNKGTNEAGVMGSLTGGFPAQVTNFPTAHRTNFSGSPPPGFGLRLLGLCRAPLGTSTLEVVEPTSARSIGGFVVGWD